MKNEEQERNSQPQTSINQGPTKEDRNNDNEDSSRVFLTGDSSLQTPEEHEHDQNINPHANEKMRPSADDLRESDIDRYAASNRNNTPGGK